MALELTVEKKDMWDVIKGFDSFESLSTYIQYSETESMWDYKNGNIRVRFTQDFTLRYNFAKNEVTHIPSFGETFLPVSFNLNRIRKKEVREAVDKILYSKSRGEKKNLLDTGLIKVISDYINSNLVRKFKDAYIEYNRLVLEGVIPEPSNSFFGFPEMRRFSEFSFDDYSNERIVEYILRVGISFKDIVITDKSLEIIRDFIQYGNMSSIDCWSNGTVNSIMMIITKCFPDDDESAGKLLTTFIERVYELDRNREGIIYELAYLHLNAYLHQEDDRLHQLLDVESMDRRIVSEIHRGLYELFKEKASYASHDIHDKSLVLCIVRTLLPKFKGDTPLVDIIEVEDYDDLCLALIKIETLPDELTPTDETGVIQVISLGKLADAEVLRFVKSFEFENGFNSTLFHPMKDIRIDERSISRINKLISSLINDEGETHDNKLLKKVGQTLSKLSYKLD